MKLKFNNMADLIASHESMGYYNIYNTGTKGGGKIQIGYLTEKQMQETTVADIISDKNINKNNTDKTRIFAFGKYQIVPTTFKWLLNNGYAKLNDNLSKQNQDRWGFALFFYKRSVLRKYLFDGVKTTTDAVIEDLSKEWASLPSISKKGASYYSDGVNKAFHTIEDVENQILDYINTYTMYISTHRDPDLNEMAFKSFCLPNEIKEEVVEDVEEVVEDVEEVVEETKVVKKNFFTKILCFFKKIFGEK